jgi:hypothetical protein
MYLKKRINGLPNTIKPQEIVLVVKDAVDLSFMNKKIHSWHVAKGECIPLTEIHWMIQRFSGLLLITFG